jgi:eukaryotic-like serine/threonine-protein kinase
VTPERWQEVKKVLAGALERPPDQRRVYLDQACTEPTLRREVESLIATHEQGNTRFMERPVVGSNEALTNGTKLGPYEILARLGAGGMGVVYRARDGRLERDVAIKVLAPGLLADESARKRFRKEALALAKLNHPSIAAVYDVGEQEGVDYLVMECVPGHSLAEEVGSGPVPQKEALGLGVQIAKALEEAHELGIVHRDLKPGNIMVTPKGQVKVLDFGLAKILRVAGDSQATESFAKTENMAGTLPYMAPEQLRGEPADARTDVHALGAVLFEMATGKRLYQEDSVPQLTDAILHRQPVTPRALNARVSPELERIILKCVEKERENRYQSAKEIGVDLRRLSAPSVAIAPSARRAPRRRMVLPLVGALVVVLGLAIGWYFYLHRTPKLTEKDSIVLADFANTTGDPVFDGTLRQGLSVQLQQSPFFSIVSGDRITQTLALMEQPRDARLTPALARQLCERVSARAVIEGSIASLDNQYVLGLNAVDCHTGEALAQEQATADGKTKVLAALTSAASELRSRLGESRASLETYDVPLVQATTSSLEALQAYSRCDQEFSQSDLAAAIQSCERAVSLDPGFAAPHALLSSLYAYLGHSNLASESARKAYELRDRASEWEKLSISGLYHIWCTGDFEKAADASLLWAQTYPRDPRALSQLDYNYRVLGRYDQALAASLEAVRLDPTSSQYYVEVSTDQVLLNRLEEARATIQGAQARSLQSFYFPDMLYWIAFLLKDAAGMGKQQDNLPAIDKPYVEIGTATDAGRLSHARDLTQGAIASATRANGMEAAATLEATSALTEVLFGNVTEARNAAMRATALSADWDSREMSALALALAGELPQANNLSADLNRRFPERTCVQFDYLPAIRAAVALHQGRPQEAMGVLRAASSYELSFLWPARSPAMMPAYVRGEAYLAAHQGAQAAAEFQRILDHQTVFFFSAPIVPLARLQLARAYTLQGDTAKARVAYANFLMLWKDADPDIPILIAAKAEFAKLH